MCANTPCTQLTMSWVKELEMAKINRRSQDVEDFLDFEMVDAKIASALRKIFFKSTFNGESVLKSNELKNMTEF